MSASENQVVIESATKRGILHGLGTLRADGKLANRNAGEDTFNEDILLGADGFRPELGDEVLQRVRIRLVNALNRKADQGRTCQCWPGALLTSLALGMARDEAQKFLGKKYREHLELWKMSPDLEAFVQAKDPANDVDCSDWADAEILRYLAFWHPLEDLDELDRQILVALFRGRTEYKGRKAELAAELGVKLTKISKRASRLRERFKRNLPASLLLLYRIK